MYVALCTRGAKAVVPPVNSSKEMRAEVIVESADASLASMRRAAMLPGVNAARKELVNQVASHTTTHHDDSYSYLIELTHTSRVSADSYDSEGLGKASARIS